MSREIKFRVWDKQRKRIFTKSKWAEFRVSNAGVLTAVNYGRDSNEQELEVMQFTGLNDCNGVEIYEGDLLRIPAANVYEKTTFNCFEVFFHDGDMIGGPNIGFCMNRMHTQGNSAGGCGYKFLPSTIKDFEIIGNIHENPELVRAKHESRK